MLERISRRGLVAGIGGVIGALISPFATHEQYELLKNEANVVHQDHVVVEVTLLENVIDLMSVSIFEFTMENVSSELIEIKTHSVLPFGFLLFEETEPGGENIENQWWPLLTEQYADVTNINFVGEFSRSEDYSPNPSFTPETEGNPPYQQATRFGSMIVQTPLADPETTDEWRTTTLDAGETKSVRYRLPNFSMSNDGTAIGTIRNPYGIWVDPNGDGMYQLELTVGVEINQHSRFLF